MTELRDQSRAWGNLFSLLVLCLLLLSGCLPSEDPHVPEEDSAGEAPAAILAAELEGDGVSVRDSAGVRIVTNTAPAWREATQWVVRPSPVLEVGVLEGADAYQFTDLWDGVVLPSGGIAVTDARTLQVRSFDSSGHHLGTFGGKGAGPGEFEAPPAIGFVAGDTLVAWDPILRRLTWFLLTGSVVRTQSLRGEIPPEATPNVRGPGLSRVVSDGSVIQIPIQVSPSLQIQPSVWLVRPDPPSAVDITAATFGPRRVEAGLEITSPFARTALPAEGVPDPVRVLVADGEDWAVQLYSAIGALEAVYRLDIARTTVTEALLLEALDSLTAAFRRPRELVENAFRSLEHPDSVVAIGSLHVDREGLIWIGRKTGSSFRSLPTSFEVLTASGRWLGGVALPPNAGQVLDIDERRILTVVRDELGVPLARVYRVETLGGSSTP